MHISGDVFPNNALGNYIKFKIIPCFPESPTETGTNSSLEWKQSSSLVTAAFARARDQTFFHSFMWIVS